MILKFPRENYIYESVLEIPYFPAHKTHGEFFVRNFRKKIMMKVRGLELYSGNYLFTIDTK